MRLCKYSVIVWLFAGLWHSACGQKETVQTANIPEFSAFKNVKDGPDWLQIAAKSVVHIETVDSTGTGSFISDRGHLLTNNHVLGEGNCAQEGCYITIQMFYQLGEKFRSMDVYAKPVVVIPEADASIYQLYPVKGKSLRVESKPIRVSRYLKFKKTSAAKLMGEDVYTLGHPLGGLKKWTKGEVFSTDANWFNTDNLSLPGNSGSPVLNDRGEIIGLVHRLAGAPQAIRKHGLTSHTIASASDVIMAAWNPKRFALSSTSNLNLLVDGKGAIAEERFLDKYRSFYALRQKTVLYHTAGAADVERPIEQVLGELCDKGLNMPFYASPDELEKNLKSCWLARHWVSCKEENARQATCLTDEQKSVWEKRLKRVSNLNMDFNDVDKAFYAWRIKASMFAKDRYEERDLVAADLKRFVKKHKPALDFRLAYYFARYTWAVNYENTNIKDYLLHYNEVPGYEHSIELIGDAYYWAENDEKKIIGFMRRLFADKNATIGDRFEIEAFLYAVHGIGR